MVLSPARAQAKPVNIGVIMPLSGANAQFGINSRSGIELVADEINAAGGIKALGGAKINLIVADATSTPTTAGTVAQRLITQNEVTAILGAFASSLTIAISEVTERRDIPLLTMSFADQITGRGFKNIFRSSPRHPRSEKRSSTTRWRLRRHPAPRSTRSRSCMRTLPMALRRRPAFVPLPRRPISTSRWTMPIRWGSPTPRR